MLSRQRKQLLLDRLNRDGQLVATELSVELGVSEDTIRRDLRHFGFGTGSRQAPDFPGE